MKRLLFGCVVAAVLSGCASSSVVVGTVRAPIDPAQVQLYVEPPAQYENVALLQASSEASFALTQQQKSNKTINRMKQEAADLGANGILLQTVGKEYAGSVGSGYAWGSRGSAWGLGSSAATYNQAGTGMAIYVYPGSEMPTPPPAQGGRGAIEAPAGAAEPGASTIPQATLQPPAVTRDLESAPVPQPAYVPPQAQPVPQQQESAVQPQQAPPPAGQMRWKPRGV